MKKFFYSFILLFTATLVCAQQTVNYVSFFPPAHIVHNEVVLKQDADSFNYTDQINKTDETPGTDYHAKSGGLVLGAAPNAKINIDKISIIAQTGDYAISSIQVNNIIDVSAKGRIGTLQLGTAGFCSPAENCQEVFLSANNITLPVASTYHSNLEVNIYSSNLATVNKLNMGSYYFLDGLNNGDKLKWVNLRLEGTEVCRKYLVKFQGDTPDNACSEPEIEDPNQSQQGTSIDDNNNSN